FVDYVTCALNNRPPQLCTDEGSRLARARGRAPCTLKCVHAIRAVSHPDKIARRLAGWAKELAKNSPRSAIKKFPKISRCDVDGLGFASAAEQSCARTVETEGTRRAIADAQDDLLLCVHGHALVGRHHAVNDLLAVSERRDP